MRLRRFEFAVIALTLSFACFMGGYFVGRRGAVSIVTVSSQNGEASVLGAGASLGGGGGSALPGAGSESGSAAAADAQADASEETGGGKSAGGDEAGSKTEPVEEAAPASAQAVVDGRININVASQSELTDLPGIGNVLAGRIVDYRHQHGPFSRIEDIRNVSGIGEKRFEAIRDRITVG